jgi:hypothetical protein
MDGFASDTGDEQTDRKRRVLPNKPLQRTNAAPSAPS